tara:strand:- start:15421 stop:16383 length:963 start_codon:yes stop_codon:yes gene_type:complete
MAAHTLKSLRDRIDPTCFPPSASDAVKTNLINKAREAIYNSTDAGGGSLWQGTQIPVQLTIITQPDGSCTVTLPRSVETIQGVYGSESGIVSPRNLWFSFLRVAPNQQPSGAQLDDLGDGYCGVVEPVAAGSVLKLTTTGTETSGLTAVVYGLGTDGVPTSESLSIPTSSGSSVTGAVLFTVINEIVVSQTAHDLIAYLRASSADTFFARYEAGETIPNYRRYRLAFRTNDTVLTAMCKRRYQLLVADNDPVDINNVLAIEFALRAYRYFQASDLKTYRENIAGAIGCLNGELARHGSDSEGITVQFEPSLMMGRVSNIP